MEKRISFRNIDFIKIPIRYIPLQSLFDILYNVISGLMPAYQAVVLANFIDCAMNIFNGKGNPSDIVLPIVLIVVYIIFMNLMPSIANMIRLTGNNKMTLELKQLILNKKAALEYKHIENTETQDLINRACFNPEGNFLRGFNNILTAARIIISSTFLIIIIMSSSFVNGIIILAMSIPLYVLVFRTGKMNYEMGKESKKIKSRYGYLAGVLIGREYGNERKLFGYSGSLQKNI